MWILKNFMKKKGDEKDEKNKINENHFIQSSLQMQKIL